MNYDQEIEEALEDLAEDDENVPELNVSGQGEKHADSAAKFLGQGKKADTPLTAPRYYADLLAWALKRYIKTEGWKTINVLGHRRPTPRYRDIETDYDQHENILFDGRLLLRKEDKRFVATIDANATGPASLVITSSSRTRKEAHRFVEHVCNLTREGNFYKGKKLQLSHRIHFLKLPSKNWQDLALDPNLKEQIVANTTGFLNRTTELSRYRIPQRRGVLLVGEPGTGKTLICKILMNDSADITGILADGSGLMHSGYICELYELAQDLSPSMVFIEDIDLIGQQRVRSQYSRSDALAALLSALDGVQECTGVVTIATTNWLEILDEALSQRPSRFDRIIKLSLPSVEQRMDLIESLSQAIPMDEHVKDYLARRTEHYTPAQVQEAVYSLVIDHKHSIGCDELGYCKFDIDEVDNALSKINGGNRQLGFKIASIYHNNGSNGRKQCPQLVEPVNEIQYERRLQNELFRLQ